jgi:hypothetical protein
VSSKAARQQSSKSANQQSSKAAKQKPAKQKAAKQQSRKQQSSKAGEPEGVRAARASCWAAFDSDTLRAGWKREVHRWAA